jgi:hypothetical protein
MRQVAPELGAHVRLRTGRKATGGVRSRTPSVKVVLFALVVAVLGGLVGVAISREAAPAAQDAATARLALPTPRPPRAAAEQSYLEALWPIHTNVERVVVRVALGASFYKLQDITRAELRTRLDDALVAYRTAGQRLRALQPPGTLQDRHQSYLSAVQLFEQSTVEMLRMYDDGSDEHLYRGFPLSVQGSDRIREVGQEFWPDEYPPN